MAKIQLGEVPDDKSRRDAVHVAIFPCKIWDAGDGTGLLPGTPVGIRGGEAWEASLDTADGILDPFRTESLLLPGEWVWVVMKPDTVKNLRHAWDFSSVEDDV